MSVFSRDDTNTKVNKSINVVPWYNPDEFKKVHDCIYSTDLKKKRWGVDQMSVWETRCHPSLPTAIEASLVIARAIVQDILLANGASLCQEPDVQMMYSMALVRFVNLTIEVHQKDQPNMVATAQIAKTIGIPSWIVDLRNEATHSFWPSLPSLRLAAEAAMKYLDDSFWEKEISTLKNLEKENFDGKEISDLIISYITLQFRLLQYRREKGKMTPEEHDKSVDEAFIVMKKLKYYIKMNKRQFLEILVSDGLFIPYDEDMKMSMSPSEIRDYDEVDEEGFPLQKSMPSVPVELSKIWQRLLLVLHNRQAIPLLLEALLKSQADRSKMGKKLIIAWTLKILRAHTLGDCSNESPFFKRLFRRSSMLVNWHTMFHAAVSRPCLYTLYVFPMIFGHLDLKKSVARYILTLMAISLGQADWQSQNLPKNHSIYSVEDVKRMKKLEDAKEEKVSEKSIWFVVEDSSYKSWPIGFVLNPKKNDKTGDEVRGIPVEYFTSVDYTDKWFFSNENDNEEEDFVDNQLYSSEDEMELSERETYLYMKK